MYPRLLRAIVPKTLRAGRIGVIPAHAGRGRGAGPGCCRRCRRETDCRPSRNRTSSGPPIRPGSDPSTASRDGSAANRDIAAWSDDGRSTAVSAAARPYRRAATMNHSTAARPHRCAASANRRAYIDDVGRSRGVFAHRHRAKRSRRYSGIRDSGNHHNRENGSRQLWGS
jgi:hypothetical protein